MKKFLAFILSFVLIFSTLLQLQKAEPVFAANETTYSTMSDDEIREVAPDFKTGDLYVSPNGTSKGTGTFKNPMDLATAINKIPAGNTIWVFSGTYYLYEQYGTGIKIRENNSGTEGAYKTISSINGKPVTFNFIGMEEKSSNQGFVLAGSYWHFYDIDICNAGDNGMLVSGHHNLIELCQFYNNHDSGFQMSRYNSNYTTVDLWPSYNTILNCTSYNNKDEATAENADGFAPKLTCGNGNVFDGCIAYCNSDDGWDMYAKLETGSIGVVTLKNCVAFGNGHLTNGEGSINGDMNGYKLGGGGGAFPTPHIVENCLAFYNGACGFTDNGNGGALTLTNCTSVSNGLYAATSNYVCHRTSLDAMYTNLVSYSEKINGPDRFLGILSHVLYAHRNAGRYYWVNNWTCTDGASTRYTGKEAADYTVKASDFINVTVPGYDNGTFTENYHIIFRNSDGSINLDGLFEIKPTSPLYTASTTGSYVGANFSYGFNTSPKYTITVNADANGTATANASKAASGIAITLTAVPDTGYRFDKWEIISGNAEITGNILTMAESDVIVRAVFKEIFSSSDYAPTENTIEAFVERMYTIALERDVDKQGHTDWVTGLSNGTFDGASVGRGIFLSPEFVGKNLSNEEFLNRLYTTFFNRVPDIEGYTNWINHLDAGYTREFVLSHFINSEEFMNLCNQFGIERGVLLEDGTEVHIGISKFVSRLYNVVLDRNADYSGYNDWVTKLATKELDTSTVAASFFGSQEYLEKNKSNEEYIADLYNAFFNRAADAEGFADWSALLDAGESRESLIPGFTGSQEWLSLLAEFGLLLSN